MKKLIVLAALALSGCSLVQPSPSTQPITPIVRLAGLQRDLTTSYDALVLAHTLGAFNNPKQWETVLTFEASAQAALNLATTANNNGDIADLDTLLRDANTAVSNFKTKASPGK